MSRLNRFCWSGFALAATLALVGCAEGPPAMPPPPPPEVEVAVPVHQEIRDYEDFTGQTEAVSSIDIHARVTGYLTAVHFEHGAEVKEGDLLFEIDPPHYQAEADRAAGVLAQAESRHKRLQLDFDRTAKLHAQGNLTQAQYDLAASDLAESEAAAQSARATLKMANVNLGYTRVTAPISGRVSEPFIDPGNLCRSNETLLTRIVAQDPMWVYFDLDERTLLRLRRLEQPASLGSPEVAAKPVASETKVYIGLADEQGYPHEGKLDFEDNRVDASTGTLRVRAVFPNAQRLLSPGLFVRVRVPIGDPYRALLIPELALGTDQGQKFVYVVNDQNEVSYRRVTVGKLHEGLRVISDGLAPEERVVVVGLQRVMPGIKVNAKLTETPALTAVVPTSQR